MCPLSPWAAHLTPVCRVLREGLRGEWPGGASVPKFFWADRFVLGLSQASWPVLQSGSGLPEAPGYCHLSRSPDAHVLGGRQWTGLRGTFCLGPPDFRCRVPWCGPVHVTSGALPPTPHTPRGRVPRPSAEDRGLPGRVWQRRGGPGPRGSPWPPPRGPHCPSQLLELSGSWPPLPAQVVLPQESTETGHSKVTSPRPRAAESTLRPTLPLPTFRGAPISDPVGRWALSLSQARAALHVPFRMMAMIL